MSTPAPAPTRTATLAPINPVEAFAHVPRGLRIALGILSVILGVLVLAVDRFAVTVILILFAVAILFLGLSAIAQGISSTKLPAWLRALQVVFGVISLGIGALYFIDPVFGLVFSTFLFGFGLVFTGFALLSSTATPGLPGWAQGLKSVIGVIEIVFGFLVVLAPGFGLVFLWIFIGVSLLLVGVELLTMGSATPASATPSRAPTPPQGIA
jgi:uncharacterized membrane protein HdeD (DUF308 family)